MNNDRFKFRVWDNVKKKYDYLECLYLSQSGGVCYLDMDGHLTYPNEDEDYIIEQCTGLKDKNGTLIYEGDKVAGSLGLDKDRVFGVVHWNERYAEWRASEYSPWAIGDIKVVGNIHEVNE